MAVVLALWNGDIVQKNNEDHDIDCSFFLLFSFPTFNNFSDIIYRENRPTSFLDPSRLAVPKYDYYTYREFVFHSINRYQNYFNIAVWLFFLAVYSIAGVCVGFCYGYFDQPTTTSSPRTARQD